jgi:hypothetical protein
MTKKNMGTETGSETVFPGGWVGTWALAARIDKVSDKVSHEVLESIGRLAWRRLGDSMGFL